MSSDSSYVYLYIYKFRQSTKAVILCDRNTVCSQRHQRQWVWLQWQYMVLVVPLLEVAVLVVWCQDLTTAMHSQSTGAIDTYIYMYTRSQPKDICPGYIYVYTHMPYILKYQLENHKAIPGHRCVWTCDLPWKSGCLHMLSLVRCFMYIYVESLAAVAIGYWIWKSR